MGDILVKAPSKKVGDTINVEDLGLEPKIGVNPDIVTSPIRMSYEEAKEFGRLSQTEEYQSIPPEKRKEVALNFIRERGIDTESGEAEEPASKFMEGTDLRTSEGMKNQFIDRMKNIPGFLDSIFALHGIDKELAYNKIGRMNLSGEDVYNQIMNNEMPSYETEEEANRETRTMRRDREKALQEISEGADVEDSSTITDDKGRGRGNIFVQRGGTRELTNEEEEELEQAMVGVKLGTGERERVLNEMGIKVNPRTGKKVKILKPSEFGQEPDSDTAERGFGGIDTNIDEAGRTRLGQRVAVEERMDKLEQLQRKKEHLENQLSGQVMLPANRDGADFKDIEDIRVGAQDELERIDSPKIKYPDHLQSLQAFANHMGIKPPHSQIPKDGIGSKEESNILARRGAVRVDPPKGMPRRLDFEEGLPTGQEFTETMFSDESLREAGKKKPSLTPSEERRLIPPDLQTEEGKGAAKKRYEQQMKALQSEFERQRANHLKQSAQDDLSLGQNIQQRIPEYLKERGVAVMPSPGAEFGMRTTREGKVTRDMGEGQNVRHHIQTMLEEDEVNGPWWQRKASELGFDLSQDEDFVESQAALGVEVGDSEFPSIAGGNVLYDPKMDASYGDRVIRKPKKFSADIQDQGDDDENVMRLRRESHKAAMSAIAKFLQSHFAEIGVEEANKHMPSYAQIAERQLSGNDRADLMDSLRRVDEQIRTENTNRKLLADSEKELTVEGMAEMMGRQHADKQANQKRAVERALASSTAYYVPTQAQSKFMRETTRALGDNPDVDSKQVLGDFDDEERKRLMQPLRDAMQYFSTLAFDMQNNPNNHNLQIPTYSHEDLPDTELLVPNERGGVKIVHSLDKLEAQMSAAESMGDEQAVKRIKDQISAIKNKHRADERNIDNYDYLKETYDVPVTDYRHPIPKTQYVQRERKSSFNTPKHLKNLTTPEVAEHVLYMLMDDHYEAMKENRYSIIDSFADDFKSENEQLYRNLGYRGLVDSFEDMSAFDQRTAKLKREIDNAQQEALVEAGREPTGKIRPISEISPMEPGIDEVIQSPQLPELRRLMGLPSLENVPEVKRPDISSQVPPATGLGVSAGAALPSPLSQHEKNIVARNQAKEELAHQKRNEGKETTLQRLAREDQRNQQAQVGADMVRVAGKAKDAGVPPAYPLANVSSSASQFAGAEPPAPPVTQQPAPPIEQPMPEQPMPAPPIEQPMPEQPMPEQPMPEQTPSSSDLGPFEGANIDINQPVSARTTQEPFNLSQEEVRQIIAINNDPNMTTAQKEAAKQKIVNKSNSIYRFNATKGDELLKSIKDRFWRQGY